MLIEDIQNAFDLREGQILEGPITPDVTPEEIRTHLAARYDFSKGVSLEEVVADVDKMLQSWQVQVTHPRYFGLFNPSVTLASVIADALVAIYNPQLASWRTSPAANEIERHTLGWLSGLFGLPADARATFTTGGAEANLTAVIVALTRAFPGYGDHGLQSVQGTPTIYLTAEAHDSFGKIAHMTGLGRKSLRIVATGGDLKMDVADLERRVAEDRKEGLAPFMVVATAGTTSAGIIDPLTAVGDSCKRGNLWFHVDAAWGGAAILSSTLRPYLSGIQNADSITCDAHKWFSVSMACGMFFCRHPESVAEAFRIDAAYMPGKAGAATFDPYTSSVQWSRRFIGLKLFMALAQNGQSGQAAMIEHQARMGQVLKDLLRDYGWDVVNNSPFPLVCFTREGLNVTAFLDEVRKKQIVWMSEARLRGVPCIRACITSFKTTAKEIQDVVRELQDLLPQHSAAALTAAER
jgi:glutamate/tyrosine decarboxylase-like PLP-dependent enzyme